LSPASQAAFSFKTFTYQYICKSSTVKGFSEKFLRISVPPYQVALLSPVLPANDSENREHMRFFSRHKQGSLRLRIIGLQHEQSRNQFASCALYKSGQTVEVLLVQPLGKGRKRWALPEVEVDSDEDMAEAVSREVAEETGVLVKTIDYLGFVDYPRGRLHCYFGQAAKNAHPQRGHLEVREVKFVPLEEAKTLVDKRQKQLLDALTTSRVFLREIA
jgi:ADP-ribose pyrophosphatase YjhB (NUDIX family)